VGFQEALHHQVLDLEKMMPGLCACRRLEVMMDWKEENTLPFFSGKMYLSCMIMASSGFQKPLMYPEVLAPERCCRVLPPGRILHIRKTGNELFVFNTHYSHVSDEARWLSARIMSERMKLIAADKALIFTGDFNLDIESETYQRLAELFLNDKPAYQFHRRQNLPTPFCRKEPSMASAYVEVQPFIDFIFVSPHFEVINAKIDRVKSGDLFISDHWPVVVKLKMKNEK
jgi:hypothetical protein